jgi:hypothetical protein
MKKSINRFALMAILGSILTSALMVGCGGGEEETAAPVGNSSNSTNAAGNKVD